jgi:hypothetical protein
MPEHGSAGRRMAIALCMAILCVFTIGLPQRAAAQDATGTTAFEGGTIDIAYPYVGAPLLSGFALQFEPQKHCGFLGFFCHRQNVDKKVRTIELTPSAVGFGRLRITFRDDTADDDFRYSVRHHSFGAPDRRTYRASGLCALNGPNGVEMPRPCQLSLTGSSAIRQNGVFVLVGFKIEYHYRDDSLSRIGIRQENGNVLVDFGDATPPGYAYHAYYAQVDYAWVPRIALGAVGSSRGTVRDQSGTAMPNDIPSGPIVLRGFDLRFTDGRGRNLNRIAVLTPDGPSRGAVAFGDKHPTEPFDWNVEWAILGSRLVAPDRIYRSASSAVQ